jgi:type VI secretion system protein ImpA
MPIIDIDALLIPISEEAPSGENLEYAGIADLERLATGDPGKFDPETRQNIGVVEPEWRKVRVAALDLFSQTKDLRAAVILTRSLIALEGLPGLSAGLELVQRLCTEFWDTVYPPLDAEMDNDPLERLNALTNLDDHEGLLRSLRSTRILESREVGIYTFRDLDIMVGRITAPEGVQVPNMALFEAAWQSGSPELNLQRREAVEASLAACNEILRFFREKTNDTPTIDGLRQSLKRLSELYAQVVGEAAPEAEADNEGQTGSGSPTAGGGGFAVGAIASRADAVRTLQQVAAFVRKSEPSSPAPMFIDRAVKLLQADFATIVRELMPDSKSHIEMLGGISLDPPEG